MQIGAYMKTWKGLVILVASVFFGVLLWSTIRMLMYKIAGLQPNMGPELFVLFAPLVAAPIALVALVIHLLLLKFFSYRTALPWFLSGVSYSSFVLGEIHEWLLLIPILTTPLLIVGLRKLRKAT